MFWPFLDELSEGKKVEDARVLVDDGIAFVVILEKVIDFFGDELFDIVFAVGLISLGSEVEGVVVRVISFFEDA